MEAVRTAVKSERSDDALSRLSKARYGKRKCLYFSDITCDGTYGKLEICKRCLYGRINSALSFVINIYNSISYDFHKFLVRDVYNKIVWMAITLAEQDKSFSNLLKKSRKKLKLVPVGKSSSVVADESGKYRCLTLGEIQEQQYEKPLQK